MVFHPSAHRNHQQSLNFTLFPLESPITSTRIPVIRSFGEKTIYFHSSTFSNTTLLLNPSSFPGIEQGDILYFQTSKNQKPTIYLEVGSLTAVQNNVAISIQEKLGRSLNLLPQQVVQVGSCSRESVALSSIEIIIIAGCLPRQEIWQKILSLQRQFVYVQQHLNLDECEIEITRLTAGNRTVFGGVITAETNCFFYRNNCRMYVVVHITREILCMDSSGFLRGEIVADSCLRKIQEMWKQGNTHHLVTVMLMMRWVFECLFLTKRFGHVSWGVDY